MTRLLFAYCFLALAVSMTAPPDRSSVRGTILDSNGAPVPDAPIQVKNKTTGVLARTTSPLRWPLYPRQPSRRGLRLLDRDAVLRLQRCQQRVRA